MMQNENYRNSNIMLKSDNATIQNLDSVLNKGGIKKLILRNFVVYDIDYLLENLAREISMLYQAKNDFNNPIQKTIDKNEQI